MPDNSIRIEIDASELHKFISDLKEIPSDPEICEDISKILKKALTDSTDWAFKNESSPYDEEKWPERVIDREYAERMSEYGRLLAVYNAQKGKKGKKGEKSKGRMKKPKPPAKPHPKLQLNGINGGLRGDLEEDDVKTGKTNDGKIYASLGTNLEYARIHQLGGKTGRNHSSNIPARPYLGLTKYDKEAAAERIGDLLSKAIRDAAK